MNVHTSPTTRTLADLMPGDTGIVAALHAKGPERRRLMDLGILPGTRIEVELRSPLGDPTAYKVRGTLVGLRRSQAQQITLQGDEEAQNEH
ncbi:MAG TPA: FeoA family protein [Aggregatilinea sp.]|jgi:Fe2+ transport system protein FeoA|uniref:FeoA family protein n=1 Tax=Aggregatilinea sp. TaxID=2806333 RepID=UPI002B89BE6A|nr:FeoA family protein [Aggregatilinea sp.]HML20760.1 FeoA family protein [Aggregatilinea sp.]